VSVYTEGTDVKPSEIARKGLAEAKKKNIDVVIVDTAGRLQVNTLFVSGHLDSYKICPVTLCLGSTYQFMISLEYILFSKCLTDRQSDDG
jgi:hypothetical protein